MGISSKMICNFAGGEASPSLYGRTDVVPYFACAKTLENVLVTHFGSAYKTPGTHYVAKTKGSAAVKLIPFVFSTGDSYMLEFGNLYMRVFRSGGSVVESAINISGITKANPAVVTVSGTAPANGSTIDIEAVVGMTQVNNKRFKTANRTSTTFQLQDEDGNNVNSSAYTTYSSGGTIEKVYELVTPYLTADLGNIRFTQQADIVYINCKGYAPRKLSRFGHASWTLTEYVFDKYSYPPFRDANRTDTTITPSAATGNVTLTASSSIFSASNVGMYISIGLGFAKITGFTSGTVVSATVITDISGIVLDITDITKSTSCKVTVAGEPPVSGTQVTISNVIGMTQLNGNTYKVSDVSSTYNTFKLKTLAGSYVDSTGYTTYAGGGTVGESSSATTEWAFGAWNDTYGYPEDCTFFEGRLYHIATANNPISFWGSVIGEYENYQLTSVSGEVNDEDAVYYEVSSNQIDKLNWVYPTNVLNMGSAGGPFTASSGSDTMPITATNISVKQQNENGTASISPVRIGSYVYYVERSGKVLGQFAYSLDADSYITENITYLSDHILGDGVVEMGLMRYPYNVLFCVLTDGTMATLTREQKNEVKGWTRQVWSGDVERVSVIPNGTEDQVWFVIKRTINSVTRRYVEYMSVTDFGLIADAFFVQSGLTYSGTPTTTITGLDHLEGETVQVLVDGATHPDRVVTGGAITLISAASKVTVGLGYTATIETLDIEAGSATGTAMSKPKLIGKVSVRLRDSVGCSVGTATTQDVIPFRSSDDEMDNALPMFSGDREVVFPQGWSKEKTIRVVQSQPLPMHLLAIYPKINVSD